MRGRTGTPRRAAAFQTAAKAASPSAPPLSQLSRSLSAAQVQLSSAAQRRSWRALFRLDAHCTRPSWCLRRPRSSLLRPRRLFPRAMPPCMLPSPSLPRMLGTAASAMAPSRGGPRTSLAALLSSPFRWPCLRFWTLAGLTPRARRLLRSGSASSTAHPRALAWSGGSSLILVAPRRPWPLSARHPQSALSRCLRSLCPRPCPAPWPSAMLPWLLQQGGRPSASSERHARLRSRMNVGRAAGARCLGTTLSSNHSAKKAWAGPCCGCTLQQLNPHRRRPQDACCTLHCTCLGAHCTFPSAASFGVLAVARRRHPRPARSASEVR
ncbi:hypothetical protein FA09DRAFT_105093 [Tilletiopsis washingtonensis]|uniref:Uncharacterized protein n=1 Tax=Tilletiopsis washingtonensis TaxID=58919 RepID=A0A316Z3V4_9BASI|nr:hypothetical protein FA09DRAFT_105093 [Tilletiopsis washingtonensis]PWN96056.1 hypothetical protein FA09DRAFT_105093 [Tilletiopsis washingtonensis]